MEHEIEISYPVPRRRLLDLRRLRRAALRFLCASGALCLFINLCTGGPTWSLVVLVSLWFVWTNLLARPLVEDGLAERISRLLLSVCILVLTVELCFDGEYTGIVLPILLACTLAFLAGTAYLGRRRRLMPLLRLAAVSLLDILSAALGLLPLNLPAAVTLLALGLAALLPALFLYRRELVRELQKRLHR